MLMFTHRLFDYIIIYSIKLSEIKKISKKKNIKKNHKQCPYVVFPQTILNK